MEDGLAVWDAGPPIADHERSRIFERVCVERQARSGQGRAWAWPWPVTSPSEMAGASWLVTPGDQP